MQKNPIIPVNLPAFVLNLLVLASAVGLLLIHQNDLPPSVPLWFSKPWGQERLASPTFLWLFPTIILFFLLLNNLIAKLLFRTQRVLAAVLVWSALIVSLILLFPLYRILLVVI